MNRLLAGRRARLVLLLTVATAAIAVLAFRAAGPASSYYVTPEEFASRISSDGQRWRVGGRVDPESIVKSATGPIAFTIRGEHGESMSVDYDGVVPNLFGPNAFVVVEGTADRTGHIAADSVIIKHENEFFSETPPPGSTSSTLLPSATPGR